MFVTFENNAEKLVESLMVEYAEELVARAFVSMSDCHTCLKEGIKMAKFNPEKSTVLKEFKIDVTAGPDITVNIVTRDPCDALAISGALIKFLRQMDKEPKALVMS
jgi:hypothetical protein